LGCDLGRRERLGLAVDGGWIQPGHAFDLHAALLELPLAVLFQHIRTSLLFFAVIAVLVIAVSIGPNGSKGRRRPAESS